MSNKTTEEGHNNIEIGSSMSGSNEEIKRPRNNLHLNRKQIDEKWMKNNIKSYSVERQIQFASDSSDERREEILMSFNGKCSKRRNENDWVEAINILCLFRRSQWIWMRCLMVYDIRFNWSSPRQWTHRKHSFLFSHLMAAQKSSSKS